MAIDRPSASRLCSFHRTGNGSLLTARRGRAEGRSVMVCFDYTTNSPIPVPAAWRTALARMMDTDKKTART